MNIRSFTANADNRSRELIAAIFNPKTSTDAYRKAMYQLGQRLGLVLASKIPQGKNNECCVACTVEDADYLAAGFIEALEQSRQDLAIHLACFWNEPSFDAHDMKEFDVSRIIKTYKEPTGDKSYLIVLKSIISGGCVVATNITHLIGTMNPEKIYIVAPLMLSDSPKRLRKHFGQLVRRFDYINLATDSERARGVNVYQSYGWQDADDKNVAVPKIVELRRERLIGGSATS